MWGGRERTKPSVLPAARFTTMMQFSRSVFLPTTQTNSTFEQRVAKRYRHQMYLIPDSRHPLFISVARYGLYDPEKWVGRDEIAEYEEDDRSRCRLIL
jgi:hypothetical protein